MTAFENSIIHIFSGDVFVLMCLIPEQSNTKNWNRIGQNVSLARCSFFSDLSWIL